MRELKDVFHKGECLTDLLEKATKGEAIDLSNVDLHKVDFSKKVISYANLEGSSLYSAYIIGSRLVSCNLRRANLEFADLTDVDLSGSDLTGANLQDADLTGANLSDATLKAADLTYTKIQNVDWSNVHDVIDLGTPHGYPAIAWHRYGIMQFRVGCRSMAADEAIEYWTDKRHRREVIAAIEYAQTVAKIRGWRIHG